MAFPRVVKVEDISRRHPDYQKNFPIWDRVRVLTDSRLLLGERIDDFLVRRSKEPDESYDKRKAMASDPGILQAAIAWYQEKCFESDPSVELRRGEDRLSEGREVETISDFRNDADLGGTSYAAMWREVVASLLLYRFAYLFIDRPKQEGEPVSREDELRARPYLINYHPMSVINWGEDAQGNLKHFTLEYDIVEAETEFPHKQKSSRYWLYCDETNFALYRRSDEDGGKNAVIADEGTHATAAEGKPPLCRIKVSDVLWLGNRSESKLRSHFNISNALDFTLFANATAPMAVFTDAPRLENPHSPEIGFMKFPQGARAEFLERSGATISILSERVKTLLEDCYRLLHLVQQGRSSSDMAGVQSGISKEMDIAPALEVLRGVGDVVREGMKLVLERVALVLGLGDIEVSVDGFDFDPEDINAEIRTVHEVDSLNLQSDTAHKALRKRVAAKLFSDDPDTAEIVVQEIDAAPTRTQVEDQRRKDAMSGFQVPV